MATTPSDGSFAPSAVAASSSRPDGGMSDGLNRDLDRSVIEAASSPRGAGARTIVRLSEVC